MTVHNIQSDDAFRKTVKENKLVLVDFFATWCAPCKAIAPIVAELSNEDKYKDAIHFTKIDVDELSDLSAELGIKTMPTLLLFKDGEKVDTLNAPRPDTLREFLDKGL